VKKEIAKPLKLGATVILQSLGQLAFVSPRLVSHEPFPQLALLFVAQYNLKSDDSVAQVVPSHFNVFKHELTEQESVVQVLASLQFLYNPESAPSESNQRTVPPAQAVL
jgi:hypothetical protein